MCRGEVEMVVVDEFYENMKAYFEETGNEYNKLIARYLYVMKQLKSNGICEGETANELQIFIDCAEKLGDATTELSSHINEVLEDYLVAVDVIDTPEL